MTTRDNANIPNRFTIIYLFLCFSLSITFVINRKFGNFHLERTSQLHSHLIKNWNFGKFSVLNQFVLVVSSQIPIYILVFNNGSEMTGILGAAVQLSGIFHVLLNGIMNFYFPIAVRKFEKFGAASLNCFVLKLCIVFFIIIGCISVILIIWAAPITKLLFSERFLAEGLIPFQIILSVGVALALLRPLDLLFRVKGYVGYRTIASIFEFLFIVIFAYPLIISFDVTGAAISLTAGRFISVLTLSFIHLVLIRK